MNLLVISEFSCQIVTVKIWQKFVLKKKITKVLNYKVDIVLFPEPLTMVSWLSSEEIQYVLHVFVCL